MRPWNAALLIAVLTPFFGISFASVASADTDNGGYVRLANLSETLTPVDIYVVPSGSGTTNIERDVPYGKVLGALDLPAGKYTVDFRHTGAAASSPPAASVVLNVKAGIFYTVAPIGVTGQGNQRRVIDLPDAASTPAGDASIQAIDAAVQAGKITFHCSYAAGAKGNILTSASVGTAETDTVPAGNWTMSATGSKSQTSQTVKVAADTDRTEIILDTTTGVQILNLLDTVGDKPAKGGISTGFGAPPGPGSPLPWFALIGAGAVLVAGGGLRLAAVRWRKPAARG